MGYGDRLKSTIREEVLGDALKKTLEVIVLAKLYLKGGLCRRETEHRTLETAYCNQRVSCCKELTFLSSVRI